MTRRPGRPSAVKADRAEIGALYAAIRDDAACLGQWALFAPSKESGYVTATAHRKAIALCAECPVFDQCARLSSIVKPTFGVWAGTVYEPRRYGGQA